MCAAILWNRGPFLSRIALDPIRGLLGRGRMTLLKRFSPPALLTDFDDIPGQLEAWDTVVNAWFDSSIASEKSHVKSSSGGPGVVQFYNPARFDPKGALVEQPIPWNAFPKELLKQYGRARALIEADRLRTLDQYSAAYNQPIHKRTFYRPQNEYCEWHAVRDPDTQKIIRITFSSEPPEYWRAMFGDQLQINGKMVKFPGNRDKVLALYRELVSPTVQMEDLICKKTIPGAAGNPPFALKGGYNMYNKWNTIYGIVHLCSPPNALQAEIQLGTDATILRENAAGQAVVLPEPLICCSQYGEPDRNSDPTIGSSVNALARLGAYITLPDPVGLYMDHIDTSGWRTPDGSDAAEYVCIVRGSPGMIERLTVEVPPERCFSLGDITIGGTKIDYGGQIAECITVKLVGAAAKLGSVKNAPVHCAGRCCIDPHNTVELKNVPNRTPSPAGTVDAFSTQASLPEPPTPLPSRVTAPFRRARWVPNGGI